jgi:hypothetical protein
MGAHREGGMTSEVIKFGGNPRPAVRHDDYPIVIVLPVIRIERYVVDEYDDPPGPPRGSRRRRNREDHG